MAHPSDVNQGALDAKQLEMMVSEDVFVVDEKDNFLRVGSKKESMKEIGIPYLRARFFQLPSVVSVSYYFILPLML